MEGDKRGKPVLNAQNDRKSEEAASNTNSSILGKRKKTREKKHWAYLQEWLDNSRKFQEEPSDKLYGPEAINVPTHPSFLWPTPPAMPVLTGQRLLTSVSDPSMCHYPVGLPSVPVSYSVEPVSLPLYSLYTPVTSPAWWQNPQSSQSLKTPPIRQPKVNIPSQFSNSSSTSNTWTLPGPNVSNSHTFSSAEMNGNVFASLPSGPPEVSKAPERMRRRFSDPGLSPVNADSGLGPSDTGTGLQDPGLGPSDSDSSDGSWPEHQSSIVASLLEQVSTLYVSNRRLTRALRNARSEINSLKLQTGTWTDSEYHPGLLAEMIRDVRDATRVRQEALMTRVQDLIKPYQNKSVAESSDCVDQRLGRIEEQLRSLKPYASDNNGPAVSTKWNNTQEEDVMLSPATMEGAAVDPEKEQLQRDLQEAVRARMEAEARTNRLEQLLVVLREKINLLSGKEKPQTPSENSPEESLTSLSSSCGSPHLTMSGPVTCL